MAFVASTGWILGKNWQDWWEKSFYMPYQNYNALHYHYHYIP